MQGKKNKVKKDCLTACVCVFVRMIIVTPPCRATMRLAMQSGTLVPAAKKDIPMTTTGMLSVKLIMVTWGSTERTEVTQREP